jgi:hypothetical protein
MMNNLPPRPPQPYTAMGWKRYQRELRKWEAAHNPGRLTRPRNNSTAARIEWEKERRARPERIRERIRENKEREEIDKLIEKAALAPVERIDCGAGYYGTVQRVGNDGRVLFWLHSPTGERLSALWGVDALRSAALSHAVNGSITK